MRGCPKNRPTCSFGPMFLGQDKRKRHDLALGRCRTRTIAERAAAEKLEQLGVNSAHTFIEVTSTVTFKQQGEIWLKSLANRKRNPLEQTTIDTRQYAFGKLSLLNDKDAALAAGYSVSVAENTKQRIWKPQVRTEYERVRGNLKTTVR
jgi:hypothetical protein